MMRFDLTAECHESEAMEQDDNGEWVKYSDARNVYVVYEPDLLGGVCVSRIYSNRSDAIKHAIDNFRHLLNKDGWSEEQLRAYAKQHIKEMLTYNDY